MLRADSTQQRRHGVHAVDEAIGDGRRGAEDDDEVDRRVVQPEQQDGEREPGDGRHGLQPGDHRADRDAHALRRRARRCRSTPPMTIAMAKPDHGAAHRVEHGLPQLGGAHVVPQPTEHGASATGSRYSGRQPDHTDELPDQQHEADGGELRPRGCSTGGRANGARRLDRRPRAGRARRVPRR